MGNVEKSLTGLTLFNDGVKKVKNRVTFILLLCIALITVEGPAGAETTVRYHNAKTLGMGNARVAGGYDYNGFVDNPALLSRVKYVRFSIIAAPLTINKNVQDIGNFISDNNDNFENFDDLTVEEKTEFIDEMREFDGEWGRIRLAPMVDIAANVMGYGVGFAVFNSTDTAIKMDQGIYEPRVWGEGTATTAVVLGIAKPVFMLYPGLTVGANFKLLNRRSTNIFQIPASDLGNISDTMDPILDKIKDQEKRTFSMDVGGLLELPLINADVGATLQAIGDGRGASLDLGIAKRMYEDKLILLADYRDFYDTNKENIFNKIHLGAQYKVAPLAFRAGINSGYPTLGLGLNFRVIDIDAAYYVEELSKGPGGNDEERFVVHVKFGW